MATRSVRTLLTGRWIGPALVFLAAGIGLLWWLADGEKSQWLYTGGLFAHSLAAALLIGMCASAPHTMVARILSRQPLRWLGSISYSLYLWHWPVSVLLPAQWTGWPRTLLVCAVSIGLAALSKYFVEDPIRFRADWARDGPGWSCSA